MATNENLRHYLGTYLGAALETTPVLIQKFIGGYGSHDPFWDFRPDPGRFSAREVIAHLADWNDIYLERLQRTVAEDSPLLPNKDEGQIAIDRDYAHSNPQDSLSRFARTRSNVVAYIKSLPADAWDRMAEREGVGPLTLSQHVALMIGHDAYHIKQAMEYAKEYENLPV